jgi:hypothetical protein
MAEFRYFYNTQTRKLGEGLYNHYNEQGTPPNPPPPKERITENNLVRLTEDGKIRITEQ